MKDTDNAADAGSRPKPPSPSSLRQRAEAQLHAQEHAALHNPQSEHELRVHQIELEMQNEELRRTQAELTASQASYVDLYDLAPVSYCTLSEKGLILQSNLTAATLLGVPRSALVKQPFSSFILKKDQDVYYLHRKQLFDTGEPQACELRMVKKDRTIFWARIEAVAAKDSEDKPVCRIVLIDITERKFQEDERALTARLLLLLNTPGGFHDLMSQLTSSLQAWSDCEAVGIRLRDRDDYPYYETRGFPPAFIQAESHLCAYGPDGNVLRDAAGNPVLECMCGNILSGRFDPSKPFFTTHGSFWSNNTTALLASTTAADRQVRTRNRCNGEGYESVALIPLRLDQQVFGLLQFNDRRPDRFTPDLIAHFENMADSLAIALARRQTEEALCRSEARFRAIATRTPDHIVMQDRDLRYTMVINPQFGLAEADMIGKTDGDLLKKEDAEKLAAIKLKVIETGKPISVETSLQTSKGGEQFFDGSYVPTLDCDGRPDGLVGYFRNVTDRKRAADSLRALSAHQNVILNTVPDIIMEVDNNRVYTWANGAGLEFFGDDVVGKEAAFFFEGEQATYKSVAPLFAGGEDVIYLESWQRRKDGEKRLLAWWCHVLKGNDGHVTGALSTARDVTDHRRAEDALRASEQEFRSLAESMPQIVWITRPDGWNIFFNQQWADYTGLTLEESYGHGWNKPFHPDDQQRAWDAWQNATQHNATYSLECRLRRADGAYRWWLIRGVPLRNASGEILKWFGTCTDIEDIRQAEAEREKLQSQLFQAQKMESVGRLAGGIAHDFNNLLMGTMGYTQFCLDKLGPDHPIREYLDEIMSGTERSAELSRQLLAFARKQIIAPKVLDLSEAVSGMLKLLRRLIGEDITMKLTAHSDTWPVKMDPVQIDQILANLAVNARDAIGGVGSITIETSNATFDEAYCAGNAGSVPGDYALLTVSDTGCGMDKETLEHLFEPFFTTKGVGEGTGLGLATVFGIVKQNNGCINVYSEPDKGTTFKIYLPRHVSDESALTAVAAPARPPRGTETILMVEDERSVRIITHMFLEDLGYTVLVAENPENALALAAQHPGEVHLLITDVIMPGMSGRDLAQRLSELRPAIKCLFISGFTADVIAQRGILDEGVHFLSKPFGRDVLARKVREVLEGK